MKKLLALVAVALLVSPSWSQTDEPAKPILSVKGKLSADDPLDSMMKKSHHQLHPVKLEAGKAYRIDLTSKQFDSFLRLESEDGKTLGADDDGGGGLNSRVVYQVPKDGKGNFRLVVTSFQGGQTGEYNLAVNEAKPADVLEFKVGQLEYLPALEQQAVLGEFRKILAGKGPDLTVPDARLAQKVIMGLEYKGDPKVAVATCKEFSKILSQANNPQIAALGQQLQGTARRLDLIGNPILVKGDKLDGKAFDWSPYKGKVVLVEFWATWCPPCRAELPNIKKMYEAYNKRGFEVVAISLDQSADIAAKYMQKENMNWACLFDGRASGKERLTDYYGITSIPQAILVDRDGKVVSLRARGQELNRLLEKMIGPEGN